MLAQILGEQSLGDALDAGGPVSIETDRADALRLVTALSARVTRVEIAEGLAKDRGARRERRPADAELRRQVDAVMAEFGGPLPEPTDAGILEADRRVAGLRAARRRLHDEFKWDLATEHQVIIPTIGAAEAELGDFIEGTPATSLAGAAAKLRDLLVIDENDPVAAALRQVLAVVERAAAGAGRP